MSTKSTIGIKRLDGSEDVIYCHWDGYISHNGVYLQLYYDTPEKIEKLLKLGNISSLQETIDKSHAYHRDGGEKWADGKGYGKQEYNYVFDEHDGLWYVTEERLEHGRAYYINKPLISALYETKESLTEEWSDYDGNLMDTLVEKALSQLCTAKQRKWK